jgi:hypothetical protein
VVRKGRRWIAGGALAVAMAMALAGCFDVQLPDLFLITRTGPGPKLTVLVNDSGTISCNGAKAKPISDAVLIQARDLSQNLSDDGTANLSIKREPGTVYYFTIKVQEGTISFPDRAADASHPNLAAAELFTLQAAQHLCGLSG